MLLPCVEATALRFCLLETEAPGADRNYTVVLAETILRQPAANFITLQQAHSNSAEPQRQPLQMREKTPVNAVYH